MNDAVKFFKKKGLKESKKVIEMGLGFLSIEGGLSFHSDQLIQLVESHELVDELGGLDKANDILKNNTLDASYFQPHSKSYYRYSAHGISIVRDGKYVEIYGGMDSSTLVHTSKISEAIADVKSCNGDNEGA